MKNQTTILEVIDGYKELIADYDALVALTLAALLIG
jgi:hypothetical protein